MAIELPNGDERLGLSQYPRCFVSTSHPRIPLDEDHIIPRLAAKAHPKLFPRNLLLSDENKAHVCKDCHRRIDNGLAGKIVTFRNYGPVGLMDFIAVNYTIPDDVEFRDIFILQRKVLFMRVRENIRKIKENSPYKELSHLHSQVFQTIDMHLSWWDEGHIVAPQSYRQTLGRIQETLAFRPNVS